MDVRERVGLNLQRLRREKGLSQEELADRAQIHQTYLSGVERGRRNPTIIVLQRIAEALNADITDLVERRNRQSASYSQTGAADYSARTDA
jgi:transcriptional regulator with XRE-family HTH domain